MKDGADCKMEESGAGNNKKAEKHQAKVVEKFMYVKIIQ